MVEEKAYAKLNLTLNVLGEKNGYHMLKSVMVPITLYDIIRFEKNDKGIMEVIGENIKNNSILQAALLFQSIFKTPGATIYYQKKIPMEAGMGGGSSDSSATLRGLNRLFELNLPLAKLKPLADTLGSDNSFLLYNQTAICEGKGEKLTFLNYSFAYNVLLIKPNFGLSTKEVFKKITSCEEKDLTLFLKALGNNDYQLLEDSMFNDLLNPALAIEPRLNAVIKKISEYQVKVFMTGSGSTLFVINEDIEKLKAIRKEFPTFFTAICQIKNTLS